MDVLSTFLKCIRSAGLKSFPGPKRKFCDNLQKEHESLDGHINSTVIRLPKRRHCYVDVCVNREENACESAADDCMEIAKQNSQLGCSKSPCAIEGYLSKGFAELFSGRPSLQSHRHRGVS